MTTVLHSELASFCEKHLISSFKNDFWWDFQLMPGQSNIWISALVIALTQRTTCNKLLSMREECLRQLTVNNSLINGVGYNQFTPSDADSSIWLARAIKSCSKPIPDELKNYIDRHVQQDNLVSTYISSDNIDKFIGLDIKQCAGWLSGHACVGTNYMCLEPKSEQVYFSNISLSSYWWPTDSYQFGFSDSSLFPKINNLFDHPNTFIPSFEDSLESEDLIFATNFVKLIHSLVFEDTNDLSHLIEVYMSHPTHNCWMILPDPSHQHRMQSQSWFVNGLIQGAAVPDINGNFGAALLLNILYQNHWN